MPIKNDCNFNSDMANELESLRKVKYHNKMDLRRESRRSYSSMNRFTMLTFLIIQHFSILGKKHREFGGYLRSLLLSMLLTRDMYMIKSLDHNG